MLLRETSWRGPGRVAPPVPGWGERAAIRGRVHTYGAGNGIPGIRQRAGIRGGVFVAKDQPAQPVVGVAPAEDQNESREDRSSFMEEAASALA